MGYFEKWVCKIEKWVLILKSTLNFAWADANALTSITKWSNFLG